MQNKDKTINWFCIEENLHEEIFERNTVWKSYKHLSKINDYFLKRVRIPKADFEQFIIEWEEYSKWISNDYKAEYDLILSQLKRFSKLDEINYVEFMGD